MVQQNIAAQEELLACEVCLEEIPVSEAGSAEATDYVVYYCGLDCYSKWKELKAKREGKSSS